MKTPTDIQDYTESFKNFSVDGLEDEFVGSFETGINVCVECCDAHVAEGGTALIWEGVNGEQRSLSFKDLKRESAKFANFLAGNGIGAGDVVAGMLPRCPELLTVILGTWRAGGVYQPLFTAFGPKAIEHRLQTSRAKFVVTDVTNRPKLNDVPGCPPIAVLARSSRGEQVSAGDIDLAQSLQAASDEFTPVMRKGNDLFLMMSTSGTTGLPKGVPVPIHAIRAFKFYTQYGIGLMPSDKFWNLADPGWAYGVYYAVIGPLLLGCTTSFYEGGFTVEGTYKFIHDHGITNLAGAPTAYRLLMAAGMEPAAKISGQLRAVSSAGEALNAEVVHWFRRALNAPIYDHYGQTEMGMVLNNHHALKHEVRAGAAGVSMPGFRVVILGPDDQELGCDQPGDLSLDLLASPLFWFTGYHQQPTPALGPRYYRTGDVAELGKDGLITFVGRNDDVITSSGYRIGPFDVESALIEHPAVVEAGVVGKPDPERTEIVKAFIVLKPTFTASDALAAELRQHVRQRLSAHAYPREIEFVTELPKTPSGKLQRFLLRAWEKQAGQAQ